MTRAPDIGAVVIGRNEGERLVRCLASLQGTRMVYVDSGSTDGSVEAAKAAGAAVVVLDRAQPFTAARARNAGLEHLQNDPNPPEYVQFVDGDCEVQPGWIEKAHGFLQETARASVVCGRRRERFPDATLYNQLIDHEWDTPIGQARSCGGDALMRLSAVEQVGGFNPTLIAGEEPELCVRLRAAGWEVWRIDAEMTLHDADITRFGQWWTRARRAGHAYAEGAALHGAPPERHNVTQTQRALIWGAGLPLMILLAALITPLALGLALIWPLQIARLALRGTGWVDATFLTLGKFPEALGVLSYHWKRLTGARSALIEYK